MRARVVITGMGTVTPLGDGVPELHAALREGRSGIGHWSHVDPRVYSKIGGSMVGFDLPAHLASRESRYPRAVLDRVQALLRATPLSGRLTTSAALEAFVDAGLHEANVDPERMAHVLGGHNVNAGYISDNVHLLKEEPDFIEPLYGLMHLDTDVLSVTSELLGLKGPSFTVGGACASGNLAILSALDLLRAGRAEVAVVSGAAVDLDAITLQGWALIDALSTQNFNDDPTRASRPFDRRREGFVPTQGAGALVLETEEHARARGATILAEVLGAAAASDASRLTKPHVDGQVRAIRAALVDARVNADAIGYVNAHATSTPLGDLVEVSAIKSVLERDTKVPVNSTKSMLGHCLTAAGVVEIIATVLQLRHGFVHPTINQEEPDPELGLDFVPNVARDHRFDVAISNSFGFGGINSCVVVGKAS